MTTFMYGTLLDVFSVTVNNTTLNVPQQEQPQDENAEPIFDLFKISEGGIQGFESKGATDITVKREQFITPNAAEGLKTYGTFSLKMPNREREVDAEYVMLLFSNQQNVLQQVIVTWPRDDDYADKVVERILDSVELNPDEPVEEEEE